MSEIEVRVSRHVRLERPDDPDGTKALMRAVVDAYQACVERAMREGLVPANEECQVDVAMVCKRTGA